MGQQLINVIKSFFLADAAHDFKITFIFGIKISLYQTTQDITGFLNIQFQNDADDDQFVPAEILFSFQKIVEMGGADIAHISEFIDAGGHSFNTAVQLQQDLIFRYKIYLITVYFSTFFNFLE